MKKIFFAALVLLSIAPAGAQMTEQLTATLRQGDKTTVFYGNDGLKSALDAAAEGAEITLSSGTFNNPGGIVVNNINIYGQGFLNDDATGIPKTSVLGDLQIGAEGVAAENISIEGIWIVSNLKFMEGSKNIQMVKCRANLVYLSGNAENVVLRQMYISNSIDGVNFTAAGMLVQNSYIADGFKRFSSSSSVLADHCVAYIRDYYNDRAAVTMSNCITWGTPSKWGSVFYNCSLEEQQLDGRTYMNCYHGVIGGDLFSDANNCTWADNRTWELKEPETYVGNDGTQIGLLGGRYSLGDKVPGVPRIVKSEIDDYTNAEGKLHLNIQAEARP